MVRNVNRTFSGQICGNTLTWVGSYPEDGGTTTINLMTATISGNSFSSSSNWSWTDGVDSCSGTTSSVGTRNSGGGGAGACERGPGSMPISGSGTGNDPYMISLGVSYGGCAPAQDNPGPIYRIEVSVGTYTVTQSNGVTDLELFIYTESGTLIATIDDQWGGFDESGTDFFSAGRYDIEVYNNGAPNDTGTQDGPFTLTVTSP